MKKAPFDTFQTIVIGAGPAGMMAAIQASLSGKRVALLEKNSSLGKKLLMTGDGRCNLSHNFLNNRELASQYGKAGDFLISPLTRFGVKETIDFFEQQGLELKTESDGRIFPKTDKAKDVLQVLEKQLKKNKVFIFLNCEVIKINHSDKTIKSITLANGEKLSADKYIFTVGGKSYPVTGSTGQGYVWLERMGHTIIKPRPSLVPVQIKESWIKKLSGLSFQNIKVSLAINGEIAKKQNGDILFAHFGLTGPIILNMSKDIGLALNKIKNNESGKNQGKVKLLIDLYPQKNQEEMELFFQKLIEKNSNQEIKNILTKFLPAKIIPFIVYFAGVKEDLRGSKITKQIRGKIIKIIKKIEFNVISLVGFDRAMATAGGVSLKEIDNKNMKSKLIDNLYLAGEIIDLDGPCGGYNLQMCWTTGYLAGKDF
ncbi:MAG: NAD(P)/FAD-dependent oxidoreductase [Candidatus Paceibacterota bacterium]